MEYLNSPEDLRAFYGLPGETSLRKVADRIIPEYRAFIERSRFCILSTVGPEGTDASPRGDDGPVVQILDERTVALPDWMGNNRIDSLSNIVRDPRVSLMFLVPGSGNVIRLNGRGRVTADLALRSSFSRDGHSPRTVIVISVEEIYFQCSRALMRSGLWAGRDDATGLPTPGQILSSLTQGMVGGPDYDRAWPDRASKSLW